MSVAIFVGSVLAAFVAFASAVNHNAEIENMKRGRQPFYGRVRNRK